MIIIVIAAAFLGFAATSVYAFAQVRKAKQELEDTSIEKDSVADVLRAYISSMERDMAADKAYMAHLKSNLQSCTDKAKAAAKASKSNQELTSTKSSSVVKAEKKPAVIGTPVKKRVNKKTN